MRHKKGISPLIATVLILGFTVALAAIIMVWGQRFTQGMQEQTQETANTQIICATEVAFKIKDVCVSSNPAGYKVVIQNDGKMKIERLVVRFYEAPDKMQANSQMFSTNGIEAFAVNNEVFNPTQLTANSVKLVEAMPVIKVSGKEVTCSANVKEYGDINGASITRACTT